MTEKYIQGADKLSSLFGEWPSFHDAEVISFSIKRDFPAIGATGARLEVNIRRYAIEYSDDIHYENVLKQNVLVSFMFHGACDIELSGFNAQNVIDAVEIREAEERPPLLKVTVESSWGFGGSLLCSSIELESVESLKIQDEPA